MNWYIIHGTQWESHGFWADSIAQTNHFHRVRNPGPFFGRGNHILESWRKLRTLHIDDVKEALSRPTGMRRLPCASFVLKAITQMEHVLRNYYQKMEFSPIY